MGRSNKSIILLQRTRGIGRLSSKGRERSSKSIILLQRTRGVGRLSSRGRERSSKVCYIVTEDKRRRRSYFQGKGAV